MKFRRHSRRSAKTSFRSFKRMRSSRRSSSGIGGDFALIGGAMAYGAGREWLSDKLQPVTTQVAGVAGSYADEVVLGALGYFMMKGKIPLLNKVGMTRDIGRAMVVIEAARIGQSALSSVMPGQSTTSSNSSGVSMLYGV